MNSQTKDISHSLVNGHFIVIVLTERWEEIGCIVVAIARVASACLLASFALEANPSLISDSTEEENRKLLYSLQLLIPSTLSLWAWLTDFYFRHV